jgi:glycosyltransferase involved in cell wall biosynthesis
MKIKNILQVTGSANMGGGAEKHVIILCTGLRELGYHNIIVCPEGKFAQLMRSLGFKVYGVDLRNRQWSAIWQIKRIAQAEKVDIVHTHHYYADKRGLIAAKLAKSPHIVTTIHNYINLDDYAKPKKINFPHWFRNTLVTHFSDRIITVSEATTKHTIKQLRISPAKVFTVHNGVELEDIEKIAKEKREKVRQEFNINPAGKYVAIIARLDAEKGHKYLFQAIPLIAGDIPELKLLVLGEGYANAELKASAQAMGIADRVVFTGLRDDVPAIVSWMDVVVIPSLIEGFGLAAIEAMALAKPVIASRVGGIPEIVVDDETGMLVPPKEPVALARAIGKILQNRKLAEQMGQKGKQRVNEKFNSRLFVKKTLAVYENMTQDFK